MTIAQIISLVVVVVLAALAGYFIIKKSEKHDLAKWVGLFILVAVALTWIFEYGFFQGSTFYGKGMNQQGLTDIPNLLYYAFNFAGDKLIFLVVLGAFYAVLNKCDGYKKLVTNIAKSLKGKEILFTLAASLLFTIMASVFTQTFVTFIFVPFIISVLLEMKLDKLTAFSVTFGSILVGVLGATYGSEGLYWFNEYIAASLQTGMIYRLLVLVIGYVLFNFFNVLHVRKVLADKKLNETNDDPFKVEKVNEKAKVWPVLVLFGMVFLIVILGYVNWEANFGITIFKTFHEWLLGLEIGEIQIFKAIWGSSNELSTLGHLGNWNLFHASVLLGLFSIPFAILSKLKLSDYIVSIGEGFKKMVKPIALYIGVYMIMLAAYMSPFIPTFTNLVFGKITEFNPFVATLCSFISGVFHVDFGLTGYLVATYFTTNFKTYLEVIHTIFTTINGFAGLFVPTSGILLIGLSYLNINYKTWIKYIWMFVLAMLAILLVLFSVMTYI